MQDRELQELSEAIKDWLGQRGHFSWIHREDVTQETLLIYWQDSLDRDMPLADPLRWCKKVAWRLMIDRHRRESKIEFFSENDAAGEAWIDARFQDSLEPEREYIAKETLARALPYIHPNEVEREDRPRTAMERWRLQQFRLQEKGLPYARNYRSGLDSQAGKGLQTEAKEVSPTSQEPLETDC